MDTERLTVTYPDLDSLMKELRGSGSVNISQGRQRGLIAKTRLQAMKKAVDATSKQGALPISVEVVYGHAWATELRRQTRAGGEVRIPIDILKR